MAFSFTRQWVTDSLLPEVLRDHRIDDFGYIETVILDAIGNEIIWDKEDNDPSFTDKYDFDEIFDVIQNMHSGDIAEALKNLISTIQNAANESSGLIERNLSSFKR